jgi:uncharacterized SAM-binding protein YcdF (DUF218 family)
MGHAAVDAIIVPGRGIADDGSLPPDPVSRVRTAVELAERHPGAHLVFSGKWTFMQSQAPALTESAAMKTLALTLGIPETRMIEEDQSVDTIGNALFTKTAVILPRGWRNLIVVSSPDHRPRVEYDFRFVFSPDYHLDFVSSSNVLSNTEYAASVRRELAALQITRGLLAGIIPGDDEHVLKMLRELHPGYSEHPKYSVEELVNKLAEA